GAGSLATLLTRSIPSANCRARARDLSLSPAGNGSLAGCTGGTVSDIGAPPGQRLTRATVRARTPCLSPGKVARVHAGQVRHAHQKLVDGAGRLAALVNGPHHQRLAAAHVPRGEYAPHAGHVLLVALDVAARVELQAKLFDRAFAPRPQKAHRQKHQLCRPYLFTAGDFARAGAALLVLDPLHAHGAQPAHVAGVVAEEFLGLDGKLALAAFLVRGAGAQ